MKVSRRKKDDEGGFVFTGSQSRSCPNFSSASSHGLQVQESKKGQAWSVKVSPGQYLVTGVDAESAEPQKL